jgi:hypothetical protein
MLQQVLTGKLDAVPLHVLLLVLGLANCFLGYRLFRLWLGVWGFVVGALFALNLVRGMGLSPALQAVSALGGGIVGALLMSLLYTVGVFLFGAGCGLLLASVIGQYVKGIPDVPLAIALSAVGGVAALVLQKPIIMALTALGGAGIALAAAGALVGGCPIEAFPGGCGRTPLWSIAVYCAWLLLAFLGLKSQAQGSRARRERESSKT